MLVDKAQTLERFDHAPVVCNFCDAEVNLLLDDDTRRKLIETGYYYKFVEELSFLERTRKLVTQFPSLVDHSGSFRFVYGGNALSPEDPDRGTAFDSIFENDPDLERFVRTSSFNLEARTSFVHSRIKQYFTHKSEMSVICPLCEFGTLSLTRDFFDRL